MNAKGIYKTLMWNGYTEIYVLCGQKLNFEQVKTQTLKIGVYTDARFEKQSRPFSIPKQLNLMYSQQDRIGIVLSVGGYRVTAFRLGTLKKLDEMVFSRVDVISTISGGSITGACYCSRQGDFDSFYKDLYTGLQTKNVIKKILLSWMGLLFHLFILIFPSSFYLVFTA